MGRRVYLFLSLALVFFLWPASPSLGGPATGLAKESKVIFSYDILASSDYQKSDAQWQISNNRDEGLYGTDGGLLLKSDGDPYLVYPIKFSYHDYDRLKIVLYSNQPLQLTLIPNISQHGLSSYDLVRSLPAGNSYLTVDFSLRLPFFKDPVNELGLNFYSGQPANIVIKEISLEKSNPVQLLSQAFKDFWRISPYSPFTVNLFPTPQIFGRPALIYFLPIILVLTWLILFKRRFWKISLALLFALWVLTDIRMSFEFFNYHLADYRSFVKPPTAEKTLRTYADFYQFADWLKNNLPPKEEISFYNFGSVHFPRLLQYLVYPVVVYSNGEPTKFYVTYNRLDITYNASDQKLYQDGKELTGAGEIVSTYNKNSFIFKEK